VTDEDRLVSSALLDTLPGSLFLRCTRSLLT